MICRRSRLGRRWASVAAFFDEDGNFVGSRVTSNIGAGTAGRIVFVAIVLPQDALEPLTASLAGWSLAAR